MKTLVERINLLVDALAAQIKELRAVKQGEPSSKSEGGVLTGDMWTANGYPYMTLNFKNTYENPHVDVKIYYPTLSVRTHWVTLGPITSTGCGLRTNLSVADISTGGVVVRYEVREGVVD